MRALTFISVITTLIIFTISCTKENKTNSNVKSEIVSVNKQSYSGKVTEYYKNGNKKYETTYDNGKPSGKYLTWFKDGSKKAEGEYQEGQRIGLWKWYSEKGKVNFTVIYDNSSLAEL